MKAKNILEGWLNVILKPEEVEAIAQDRLSICNQCPKKIQQMGIDVCGLCHCPLAAKTRSLEEVCPLDKW